MDSQLNQEWVKRTLILGIGTSPPRESNIYLQCWILTREGFHEMCKKEINAIIYLLSENHTEKVQPIDAGFGKQMKARLGKAMEKWLEEDEN